MAATKVTPIAPTGAGVEITKIDAALVMSVVSNTGSPVQLFIQNDSGSSINVQFRRTRLYADGTLMEKTDVVAVGAAKTKVFTTRDFPEAEFSNTLVFDISAITTVKVFATYER